MEDVVGVGSAEDATVSTDVPAPSDPSELEEAERILAAHLAAVERQRGHVADAEASYAVAVANVEALKGAAE